MNWHTHYSNHVRLTKPKRGEAAFLFPKRDGIHALLKSVNGLKAKEIVCTFAICGDGVFTSAGGGTPQVRLHFAATELGTRYWSNPVFAPLKTGTVTLSVRLNPDNWQSVYGKMATEDVGAFKDALKNAKLVGMTFGDERGAFAHGAWLKSGNAKFRLISFTPDGISE